MRDGVFDLRIGGEYACFSRPEFKVERVSYLVMTPSAARGVLEAIFWKPEIRWQVREIWLLKPVRQTALLRNEISDRQGDRPFFVEEKRVQRASLILKDVEYLVRGEMLLATHADAPLMKYVEQARRRLETGGCYHRPYLGTREFAAWFEPASGSETPLPIDLDLGTTLFDIAYREDANRREVTFHEHGPEGAREVAGYAEALFFQAKLEGGVLRVPPELYQDLYRLEGRDA